MLSDQERETLMEAISLWAQIAPPEPVLGFLSGGEIMTPQQLLAAVRENSSEGQAFMEILEHSVQRQGMKAVTRRLVADEKE